MRQKKAYDFVVTLKHPDYRIYNMISVFMCVMTLTAEGFALLNSVFFDYNWINVILAAVILFTLVTAVLDRNKNEYVVTFKWALYAAAFLWLLYPLHVPFISVFFIIAALLERQIKFPQEIGFNTDGVTFNTFPFKNYSWQQVKNAMLKDNLLTLDFTNNKILQKETESDVSSEIEKEFNEFCKQQIVHSS
ncbi:MAG TPA: hypothetical protein VFW07_18715 [Parafilimonas sp.]|nr:hypothetical protein [Parafilimonas sp.]